MKYKVLINRATRKNIEKMPGNVQKKMYLLADD